MTRWQRHLIQHGGVPCREDHAPRCGVIAHLIQQSSDLVVTLPIIAIVTAMVGCAVVAPLKPIHWTCKQAKEKQVRGSRTKHRAPIIICAWGSLRGRQTQVEVHHEIRREVQKHNSANHVDNHACRGTVDSNVSV